MSSIEFKMSEEIEMTCENCKYENEDMEGIHCRHCIHNAKENFEPKLDQGYTAGYNKAIDEFTKKFIYKAVCEGCSGCTNCYEEENQNICDDWNYYMAIAEQLKEGVTICK